MTGHASRLPDLLELASRPFARAQIWREGLVRLKEVMVTGTQRLSALIVVPFLLLPQISGTAAGSKDLLGQLANLEMEGHRLCPPRHTGKDLVDRITALQMELRASLNGVREGAVVVETINRFVFDRHGIMPSHDLKDPCNLLPSRVLERRQGYCLGIAAVYLLLAEQLGLPIYAVATPSHVFLRYDDGTRRINIETYKNGANVSDERYIREQNIPDVSIRKGVFLRNLTADGFLAQIHNNLGVIYSERREYASAARAYELALALHPGFPAAYYNYGNDLLHQEEYRRAARLVTHGPFAPKHYALGIVAGIVLPLILLWTTGSALAGAIASALALLGLFVEEDILIRAGQALPIS